MSTMEVTVQRQVVVPKVPQSLRVEGTKKTVPLGKFSNEDLKKVGQLWTEALIKIATEQRV